MKSTITISLALLTLIAVLAAYAIFSSPDSHCRAEIIVEVPLPVVQKDLVELNSYPQWSPLIKVLRTSSDGSAYRIVYSFGGFESENRVHLRTGSAPLVLQIVPAPGGKKSLLGNFMHRVRIARLADGSTSINWSIDYQAHSFGARILNPIYFHPMLQSALERHLKAFGQRAGR